jgi:hypothetical protein
MTREEAVKLARRWRQEGKTVKEITPMLAKAGYVSENTGEPLATHGVYAMLYNRDKPQPTGRRPGVVSRSPDLKDTLKAIMAIPGIKAETKLNFIESALN